jgi:hypothetical protein
MRMFATIVRLVWFITMPLMIPMWITTPDPNNPTRYVQTNIKKERNHFT